MSERFDVDTWYASMRDAGQDVFAIEFVERDLQLVVTGRSYDDSRDREHWAVLVDHRDAVIAFLAARDQAEDAA